MRGSVSELAARLVCNVCGSTGARESENITLALHPWNHAPLELPQVAFEGLRAWHVASMHEQHSHIVDALSGRRLHTLAAPSHPA